MSEDAAASFRPMTLGPTLGARVGTLVLIIANVAVFVWTVAFNDASNSLKADVGALVSLGAIRGNTLESGEYWRLIAATFLHAGLFHLLANMVGLWVLGTRLERQKGVLALIGIYICAALGGSLTSALAHAGSSEFTSVGASGAISGLLGSLLLRSLRVHNLRSASTFASDAVLLLVAFPLLLSHVDSYAHAGGFSTGIVIELLLRNRSQSDEHSSRLTAKSIAFDISIVAAVTVALNVYSSTASKWDALRAHCVEKGGERSVEQVISACSEIIGAGRKNSDLALIHVYRGTAHIEVGQSDLGIADFSKAIELEPRLTIAYARRGLAFHRAKAFDRAVEYYTQAIAIFHDPNRTNLDHDHPTMRHSVYINRGSAYFAQQNYARALEDYEVAIELDPSSGISFRNRGAVHYAMRHYDLAISDFSRAIDLKPTDAAAFRNRAIVQRALGNEAAAIADLAAADALKSDKH